MSIIIRLQNLPWSANSIDIRRYFTGLSIPEGGVHIVGGEMGDAFIAFSTDEDARLAMAKDGGKIKDMQIKLLLSSRTEMMRVIEQARTQNIVVQPQLTPLQPPILPVLQPPPVVMSSSMDGDRRRLRSPSPHHRRRDSKSPARDRRRSPERRSSKRDRSRSPDRGSRGSARDTDRRGDRFKKNDRRYEDSHRYRSDRHSSKEAAVDTKKYSDNEHENSRSQLRTAEGFRETNRSYYDQSSSIGDTVAYPFGMPQPGGAAKDYPSTFYAQMPADQNSSLHQADQIALQKLNLPPAFLQRIPPSTKEYAQQSSSYNVLSNQLTNLLDKERHSPSTSLEQQRYDKNRHQAHYDSEYRLRQPETYFQTSHLDEKQSLIENPRAVSSYNGKKSALEEFHPVMRTSYPPQSGEHPENSWPEKHQTLLNPTASDNSDFIGVVPMELDPLPSDRPSEKNIFSISDECQTQRGTNSYSRSSESPRKDDVRREILNRGPPQSRELSNRGPDQPREAPNRAPPQSRDVPNRGLPQVRDAPNRAPPQSRDVPNRGPPQAREVPNRGPPQARDIPNRASPLSREMPVSQPREMPRRGTSQTREGPSREDMPRREMPSRVPLIDNSQHSQTSLTVEVRGIPPSASVEDLLEFFQGIPISPSNIHIQEDNHGAERAFVHFSNPSDLEEALTRNQQFMHDYCCEVIACPDMVFNSENHQPKPRLKPQEKDLCLQLQGLPYSCKEEDVIAFFDGLGILDVFIEMSVSGKATGVGFVELGTQQDFETALTLNGNMIGHRYITLSVASKEMMDYARGGNYAPRERMTRPKGPMHVPPSANSGHLAKIPLCVSIRGLVDSVTSNDIADFLKNVGVTPRAIHIMLRPDKKPSGDAFVELIGQVNLDAALDMNGKPLLGKRVSVKPISFREMSDILGKPKPLPPPPTPGPLLQTPVEPDRPRRPLLPEGPKEVLFVERMQRERPRMEGPIRGLRPRMEPPYGRMERPGRPPFARMRGPWPMRGYGSEGRFPPPPPAIDRGPKDFGMPGCVVSIKNLHFRAGLEELLEFFHSFELTKDSIIRKYNESGQTTGEARVAFQNPREAQRAVRELNQKPILGRPLSLSLL